MKTDNLTTWQRIILVICYLITLAGVFFWGVAYGWRIYPENHCDNDLFNIEPTMLTPQIGENK